MFFLSKEFIHLAAEGKYIFEVSQAFQVISVPFATKILSFSFSSPSICHIPTPLKSGITKGKERRSVPLSPHVRAARNCVYNIGSRSLSGVCFSWSSQQGWNEDSLNSRYASQEGILLSRALGTLPQRNNLPIWPWCWGEVTFSLGVIPPHSYGVFWPEQAHLGPRPGPRR